MFSDDRADVDTVLNHKIIGKLDEYDRFTDKYEYAVVCIGENVGWIRWGRRGLTR